MPITILPGAGMLIFSTTGQMMSLSAEVGQLLSNKCTEFQHQIAELKIAQIKRLTFAASMLYIAAGMYVLSGLTGALLERWMTVSRFLLIGGTFFIFGALILLIVYAFKTIVIRQLQFDNNHLM